jgi:ASC-1-like (ASCH) protein
MIQDKLKDMAKSAIERAKKEVGKDVILPTAYIITSDDKTIVVGMPFRSYDQKRAAFKALDVIIKQNNSLGAVVINEAWYKEQSVGEEIPSTLYGDPARKECLIAIMACQGWCEAWYIPFIRTGEEIIFKEKEVKTDITDRSILLAFERWLH